MTVGTMQTMQYTRLTNATTANMPWTASTVYDLAWPGTSFPTNMEHALSSSDVARLARIEADYHQIGAVGDRVTEGRMPDLAGSGFLTGSSQIMTPGRRTDYVSPGIN
jgi:hypothetical protein